MRKIILKLMDGEDAGSLTEDGGQIVGEGRGQNLVEMAPGKDFDAWVESLGHSKYLQFEVQE